jgi:hypothetical protein
MYAFLIICQKGIENSFLKTNMGLIKVTLQKDINSCFSIRGSVRKQRTAGLKMSFKTLL